jgi:hypothetical protein
MSPLGPSRHFAATQQFSSFQSEADIQRAFAAVLGFDRGHPPQIASFRDLLTPASYYLSHVHFANPLSRRYLPRLRLFYRIVI